MKSVFQNSKTASPALPKSLWVFTIMLSFVFVSHAPSAGPRILFSSTRDGNPEIYTMNLDGSNVVNLSLNIQEPMGPLPSPSRSSQLRRIRRGRIEHLLLRIRVDENK